MPKIKVDKRRVEAHLRRDKQITIRMNAAMKEEIAQAAKHFGLSMTDYLIGCHKAVLEASDR